MLDFVAHYQFAFFAPGTQVEPSQELIAQLMEVFKDKGFLPNTSTIQTLQIGPVRGPAPEKKLQLQMITKTQEWTLAFEPIRLLLTKRTIPNRDIGTAEDFSAEAVEICSRLLRVIPLIGTRLAYVTQGLLPEMSADELAQVNSRLIILPAFYLEHPAFQWTTRNAARYEFKIGDKNELINVITDINRIQGYIRNQPLDRIEIKFDINTSQENMTPRFGSDNVGVFLQEAVRVSQRILTELGEKFNG